MSRRLFNIGHRSHKNKKDKSLRGRKEDHSELNSLASPPNVSPPPPQVHRRKSSDTLPTQRELEDRHPDDSVILNLDGYADIPKNLVQGPSTLIGSHPPRQDSRKGQPADKKPRKHTRSQSGSPHHFDLRAPPPNSRVKNIDILSEKLFSTEHLQVILREPPFFLHFKTFLDRQKPYLSALLRTYLESQKAYRAIEYANAVSENLKFDDEEDSQRSAAFMDSSFIAKSQEYFKMLVTEALPAYVAYCLTQSTTQYMVQEITGTSIPYMRELVSGLAEVFVLVDPNLEDNPIVLASEEFYRTSRYARDDVIGHNCRFLQGPKSSSTTITRLKADVEAGRQSNEAILNYRRDGQAFMNLLLIAPLHDNRGNIKYFIGAQIDVSGLVEDGRGLESFERVLSEERSQSSNYGPPLSVNPNRSATSKPHHQLSELAQTLSLDESAIFVRHHHQQNTQPTHHDSSYSDPSSHTPDPPSSTSIRSFPHTSSTRSRHNDSSSPRPRRDRLVLTPHDSTHKVPISSGPHNWPLPPPPSNTSNLPGVYQHYLLVRPAPSLRITFVSPALRIPGLLQSRFLDHVVGPEGVKTGLIEALDEGESVTAKIVWRTGGAGGRTMAAGREIGQQELDGAAKSAKTPNIHQEERWRYLNCTPLFGADDQVGVWMVVIVDEEMKGPGGGGGGGGGGVGALGIGGNPSGVGAMGRAGLRSGEWLNGGGGTDGGILDAQGINGVGERADGEEGLVDDGRGDV